MLITIEEGSVGGFASHVLAYLEKSGALDRGIKVRSLTMPDRFVDQGKPEAMYAAAGLDADGHRDGGLRRARPRDAGRRRIRALPEPPAGSRPVTN